MGLADVTITWAASSDEGFLGGTGKYQVFRSATIGGTYAQVGLDINGVGIPQYSFTDANVAPNTFFYYVRSIDGVGLMANSSQTAGRSQFAVSAGMNYLSVPFIQADESIGVVLQTVGVRGAWTYDRCAPGGAWYSWSSQRPAGHNSLQTVSHRVGLIVDATAAGAFAVAGIVPSSTTFNLCAGWNLVGYPSFRAGYTVLSLKTDAGVLSVLGFSPTAPGYTVALADSAVLQTGATYWVKVNTSSTWIVPGR